MIELKTTLFYAMNHENFEFPEAPNAHRVRRNRSGAAGHFSPER